MDDSVRKKLLDLLAARRLLSLAVQVDDEPFAGALPFAARPDHSAFLVHASQLARHTRGLGEGAPFAFVIHDLDTPDADALQLPRLMLQGRVRMLPRDSEAYVSGRDLYVERFPESAPIFGLGDFDLYELVPDRGRFVTGFAGIHNLDPDTLRELSA